MHQAPVPVVSARPYRPRVGPSNRARHVSGGSLAGAAHRRPLEALESRVLFAAGDFDLTFGGDGSALVNFIPAGTNPASSDYGSTVAILPGGKMIVGGSVGNGTNTNDVFGLTRLNADGSLDLTFGDGDGLATLDFGPGDEDLESIAIAPDGKIVAVGKTTPFSTGDWAVARFNADGSPDATFSGDGMVTTDFFGFTDTAYGVDVQSDGKIVVTGVDTGVNSDMAVVRYNTDGTLDATFNDDGKAFINFFGGVDFASAVKVQPDGKLIIVGGSVRPGAYRQFVLVRLNADGQFDSTFDGDGQATADFGASAFGKDVELQSDGKYVVGGWVDSNPTGDDQLDFAVARFNVNGSLDTTFGAAGRTVFTGTGGDTFRSYGLEIQQNGKILLGGTTKDPNYASNFRTYAGVARLNVNGTPDTTFGPGGLRQFTIPGTDVGTTTINDLELQPDGSIVLAGYPFGSAGGIDFAVVRLTNDDGPPPLPGSISGVVFNDANENGVRDAGEGGLSGWTVYQDLNNNGVFDSGAATIASTDVPKPISAVGTPTVLSDLVVMGVGTIADLNVTLDITHDYNDDLTITLISPSGQEIRLISRRGGGGENFTNTVLDDEATQSISTGSAPFTGSYRPEQVLRTLDGTSADGTWKLKIFDGANEDGGSLIAWSLSITAAPEPNVTSGADGSYTFLNVPPGSYTIREVVNSGFTQTSPAGGAYVVNVASGQAVTGRDFGNINQVLPSTVVARSIFYNNSGFDGYNVAANAQDDAAIATDKQALRPGQTAAPANVTSYSRGINGVMIDMTRLNGNLEADDFEFRFGNTANPALWTAAPAPLSITERSSGRPDGATRVSIVWADNAIRNQWLQVTVKANSDTRLAANDVFYFGNLVGETTLAAGSTVFKVDAADVLATRNGPRARNTTVPVTERADHNKDRRVNVLDEMIVRGNVGTTLVTLASPATSFGEVAITSARRTRGVPVSRSVLA